MKNLLSLLTEISKWLKVHSVTTQARAMPAGPQQGQALPPGPTWEKLGILLVAQAQVHAMDAGETRNSSTSIKPENLDMALRELRLAQRFALSELENNGTISEDVLNGLCAHIGADISEGASPGEYPAGELRLPENRNE